ncbi:carbohydrate ABC transporter permease [Humidisolicoccus flavus]|uniref:carbohydrate ABC transporter permease n=1 Tax=Humidisolicoccus flavus TaxID=3111414 RepID=UPI0032537E98
MPRVKQRPQGLATRYSGVAFVTPSFIILTVIVVIPIIMTLYFSFTSYSILGSPNWSGTANYERLVADEAFRSALGNTAIYTLISVPLQTVISLLVAALLAARFRNRMGGFVRSALFIPVMSSMIVVGTVWRFIFGTDDGLMNAMLGAFGIDGVNVLGNPQLALLAVSLVTVWKNIGYFLVIYYAAIMEIPRELYEASSIDGAGPFKQFRFITIPALRPITFLVVILGTIWSFQVFDLVYTMTGGGPGGATVTLVMAIYQAGFKNYQMGYASAMAIVLFVIVLVIAIVQRRLLAKSNV